MLCSAFVDLMVVVMQSSLSTVCVCLSVCVLTLFRLAAQTAWIIVYSQGEKNGLSRMFQRKERRNRSVNTKGIRQFSLDPSTKEDWWVTTFRGCRWLSHTFLLFLMFWLKKFAYFSKKKGSKWVCQQKLSIMMPECGNGWQHEQGADDRKRWQTTSEGKRRREFEYLLSSKACGGGLTH